MLQGILNKYKNWLVPVFLVFSSILIIMKAIATHNPEMGDWLTSKFLEFNQGESHSKLVLDIILVSTHDEEDFADLVESSSAIGFLPKFGLSADAVVALLTRT